MPAADESDPSEPSLPVASVARRLGVAPATLRTWDRRYGLGPSHHVGGRHRRYGPRDIGRLELMQQALLRGTSTAEAARYALERMPKAPEMSAALRIDTPDGELLVPSRPARLPPPPSTEQLLAEAGDPGQSRLARRLSTAALALDSRAVERTLAEAIERFGVLSAWSGVLQPVLTALADRWRGSGNSAGAEVEYLLADAVLAALIRATPVLDEPRNVRPVLLSSVPEERDGLALYALAAELACRGVGTQLFATPLPAEVLAVAVRRAAPAAVVLWARRSGAAHPRLFSRVMRGRQRSRLFACGPGWDAAGLPAKVELLDDLAAAVDRVEYVLLGPLGPRD
ncbi:MerR family transcriptional regulator [Amycolatopsis albispora]|uniref:MerR family transcriptional regulator n=1 Tax=Amycolatopsis albispora TaxID=1804986 RepID=A0A344LFS7_9PSEU|nr:MerR family transcriptional regulator [Amycolatopsis albispora]AXB46901.1 MerR family transcriptional regulator [Amycolatopsis albispora]